MKTEAPVIDRPVVRCLAEDLGPDRVSLVISGTQGARDSAKFKRLRITTVLTCA